jgi:hypothetical protein
MTKTIKNKKSVWALHKDKMLFRRFGTYREAKGMFIVYAKDATNIRDFHYFRTKKSAEYFLNGTGILVDKGFQPCKITITSKTTIEGLP